MMSKKLLSLLAVAAMAVSVFAGCGNTDDKDATPSSSEVVESSVAEESSEEVKEFSYPMEPTVYLTINFGSHAGTRDSEGRADGPFGVFDALTGIVVEDTGVSFGSGEQDFMLMLISGDLPDLLYNQFNKTYKGGAVAAIDEGYIIDLNEYKEYIPNYLAWLEANPGYAQQVTTEDGRLWAFASIEDTSVQTDRGITIRKDILDALGMEIPATIDEFYNVLKAVKANYPDMIPFATEMRWMYTQSMSQSISGAYGTCYPFYTTDGTTVQFALYDDNFKSFLQTMNKWYDEGLIHPDFATVSKGDVRGGLAKNIFAVIQQGSNSVASKNACEIEGAEFVAIPFLTLEEGATRYNFEKSGYVPVTNFISVSTDCENIEAAMRYCDFLYTKAGNDAYNYGKEGVAYSYAEDGSIVLGDVITNNPNGKTAADARYDYAKVTGWIGEADGTLLYKDAFELSLIETWQTGLVTAGVSAPMTDEENGIYGEYYGDLDTFAQEKIVGLILGTISFDEWDNIKAEAKNSYHADEVLAVMQSSWTNYIQ